MIKRILKFIGKFIIGFVAFVIIYLLCAFILSRIAVDREAGNSSDVTIFIKTNGVHTDIVVPVKNDQFDWSQDIKFENTVSKDSIEKYVAFGWGDKGFYLETPTWGDLTFTTAFKAAFALGTAAIHATFYKEMKEADDCVRINISKAQYQRLIEFISKSFKRNESGKVIYIPTNAMYGKDDAFYDAGGSYSLLHTCNTWSNNALKKCGQKACLWTPFDKGIFYQYGH